MTIRRYFKVMSLIMISVFVFSLAVAQEKKDDGIKKLPDGSYRSKDYDESSRPDDNYLAKFHANDIVDKLIKRNIDEIYLIKVLVTNNSGKGWDAKYQEVYNGYKDGMEQYYKRNMVYSADKLTKNQAAIREMFKVIIEDYKKQCEDLLNECAGKVLVLHLDVSSRVDPDKAEQLTNNHIRLRISYGQLDDAVNAASEKYFAGSIYHLRVARSYGISILLDLAKDDNERKSIRDKYRTMMADNQNRIYAEKREETKTK